VPFDPDHDALEFHAAQQEAFADHWDYTPRDFESWSKGHLESERFDPALWCVVRAGNEIAAGTICTGDTYGGGFVHALFTRRPWRRQGVGAGCSATRSDASGSAVSAASGSASTRRATPARSASTSAPA
jgi:GNAT superfamily N-acetyltransferase